MEKLTKEKAKALVLRTVRLFLDNNMMVYSGNATLFIITAAFPFVMLIISIINLLPGYSPADVSAVLFQVLPDLGSVRELVESMISNLKKEKMVLDEHPDRVIYDLSQLADALPKEF